MDNLDTADELFKHLQNAPAILNDIEATHIENITKDIGVTRRIASATLSKTGKHLVEGILKDRQTAVAFADGIEIARYHLKQQEQIGELIETFIARVEVALCYRPDYEAIKAEVAE